MSQYKQLALLGYLALEITLLSTIQETFVLIKFASLAKRQFDFLQKQPPEACNFIKKESLGQVYCAFCGISKNTFFTDDLWTTASIRTSIQFINGFSQRRQTVIMKGNQFYSSLLHECEAVHSLT